MIERRDNALWIDLEVFGFELLVLEEIDILSSEARPFSAKVMKTFWVQMELK